ncbi:MAG: TIM barrel protein [Candidatus Poribacteria bacterium]|nr:TIM barrel protein [Candidatus Poribacteria bacterium]
MRLGGFFGAGTIHDLKPLCDKMDTYGLSALGAPGGYTSWSDDDCAAYGERARSLNMVVGEAGFWQNLLSRDENIQNERIARVRLMLQKADAMGCRSVVTLVGTDHPNDSPVKATAYMYSEDAKKEFYEIVMRVLDGLDLKTTKYIIEPWTNTFFYQPADIRAFIERVDHPAFGVHLDQMNMVSQATFFNTTALIRETFDLLAPYVASVHLKDVQWDHGHLFYKLDEVNIGDGVMDYDAYLTRLTELHPDMPCYCEHMATEKDYALNWARLHHLARKSGTRFLTREDSLTV